MPMHDWTKLMHDWFKPEPGVFNAFHHQWISEIAQALNRNLLPSTYYALPEQLDFRELELLSDSLTSSESDADAPGQYGTPDSATPSASFRTRPRTRFAAQSDGVFRRRWARMEPYLPPARVVEYFESGKNSIVVRDVSSDRMVALIELVSPGNRENQLDFVDDAIALLEHRIHLLIVDLFPPGPGDPNGVHAAIWMQVRDDPFQLPADRPLTLVAYECGLTTRAYIETVAVGQSLPDMPLFLEPNACVMVPLEATYQAAFVLLPKKWQTALALSSPA